MVAKKARCPIEIGGCAAAKDAGFFEPAIDVRALIAGSLGGRQFFGTVLARQLAI